MFFFDEIEAINVFSKLETWSFTRCHNHQDPRPLAPGHRGNKLSNPVC